MIKTQGILHSTHFWSSIGQIRIRMVTFGELSEAILPLQNYELFWKKWNYLTLQYVRRICFNLLDVGPFTFEPKKGSLVFGCICRKFCLIRFCLIDLNESRGKRKSNNFCFWLQFYRLSFKLKKVKKNCDSATLQYLLLIFSFICIFFWVCWNKLVYTISNSFAISFLLVRWLVDL